MERTLPELLHDHDMDRLVEQMYESDPTLQHSSRLMLRKKLEVQVKGSVPVVQLERLNTDYHTRSRRDSSRIPVDVQVDQKSLAYKDAFTHACDSKEVVEEKHAEQQILQVDISCSALSAVGATSRTRSSIDDKLSMPQESRDHMRHMPSPGKRSAACRPAEKRTRNMSPLVVESGADDCPVSLVLHVPTVLQSIGQKLEITLDMGQLELAHKLCQRKVNDLLNAFMKSSQSVVSPADSKSEFKTACSTQAETKTMPQATTDSHPAHQQPVNYFLPSQQLPNSSVGKRTAVASPNNKADRHGGQDVKVLPVSIENENPSEIGVVPVVKKIGRKKKRKHDSSLGGGDKADCSLVVLDGVKPTNRSASTLSGATSKHLDTKQQPAPQEQLKHNYWPTIATSETVEQGQYTHPIGGLSHTTRVISQDDYNSTTQFEDIVRFIEESNNDGGNNVIARVLNDNSSSLIQANAFGSCDLVQHSNGVCTETDGPQLASGVANNVVPYMAVDIRPSPPPCAKMTVGMRTAPVETRDFDCVIDLSNKVQQAGHSFTERLVEPSGFSSFQPRIASTQINTEREKEHQQIKLNPDDSFSLENSKNPPTMEPLTTHEVDDALNVSVGTYFEQFCDVDDMENLFSSSARLPGSPQMDTDAADLKPCENVQRYKKGAVGKSSSQSFEILNVVNFGADSDQLNNTGGTTIQDDAVNVPDLTTEDLHKTVLIKDRTRLDIDTSKVSEGHPNRVKIHVDVHDDYANGSAVSVDEKPAVDNFKSADLFKITSKCFVRNPVGTTILDNLNNVSNGLESNIHLMDESNDCVSFLLPLSGANTQQYGMSLVNSTAHSLNRDIGAKDNSENNSGTFSIVDGRSDGSLGLGYNEITDDIISLTTSSFDSQEEDSQPAIAESETEVVRNNNTFKKEQISGKEFTDKEILVDERAEEPYTDRVYRPSDNTWDISVDGDVLERYKHRAETDDAYLVEPSIRFVGTETPLEPSIRFVGTETPVEPSIRFVGTETPVEPSIRFVGTETPVEPSLRFSETETPGTPSCFDTPSSTTSTSNMANVFFEARTSPPTAARDDVIAPTSVMTRTTPQKLQNLRKIQRTINQATPTSKETFRRACSSYEGDAMPKLFGVACWPSLVDRCHPTCLLSHQLLDASSVRRELSTLSEMELLGAYRFMYNHHRLFRSYFTVFCDIFEQRSMCIKLLKSVNDCERYEEGGRFIRHVFCCLVRCGLNKVNVCRQILVRSRNDSSAVTDELVDIIIESGWTLFCDYLEYYADNSAYKFSLNAVTRMARIVRRNRRASLTLVLFKCLLALRPADLPKVQQSPLLLNILESVKNGTAA